LLWFVALLNYMDRQMLSTMKVAMMGDIVELEKAGNFGRLMAIFLWIYALMSPMAGLIADRVNRKWLIIALRLLSEPFFSEPGLGCLMRTACLSCASLSPQDIGQQVMDL
jgi:MFS family permease